MSQPTADRPATLVWDTATLRKGLQRQIFSSLVEMSGGTVQLVEQTARELARLVDPRAPREGLRTLYEGFENPEPIRHLLTYRTEPRVTIQHQIWWAEEFARPDGLYRPTLLDDDTLGRFDDLMDSFCATRALPELTEDDVREHPDAITICQAAAIDGKIIVTPDQDFQPNRLAANTWARDQYRRDNLSHPMIVTAPDRELEDWCTEDPDHVLKSLIGAAWPADPTAAQPTVEERVNQLFANMNKVEYFRQTGQFCKQRYADHPEPCRLIEAVRANLPVHTRAADARHPANPANRGRNWATPDDSVRTAAGLPRWQLHVSETAFQLDEHTSALNYATRIQIPVTERQRIIDELVERGIEVQGTPRHGGSKDDSAGFGAALNSLINAELSKIVERGR